MKVSLELGDGHSTEEYIGYVLTRPGKSEGAPPVPMPRVSPPRDDRNFITALEQKLDAAKVGAGEEFVVVSRHDWDRMENMAGRIDNRITELEAEVQQALDLDALQEALADVDRGISTMDEFKDTIRRGNLI